MTSHSSILKLLYADRNSKASVCIYLQISIAYVSKLDYSKVKKKSKAIPVTGREGP
jgi:hypothetical protein